MQHAQGTGDWITCQGLVKDSPTFKNFSIKPIHYFSAMTWGVG